MHYYRDSSSNGLFALIIPLITFLLLVSIVVFIVFRKVQKRQQRAKLIEETYTSIPTQVLETDKQPDPSNAV